MYEIKDTNWDSLFVTHDMLALFVYGNWVLLATFSSLRIGVKFKSQSRELNYRFLSLFTKMVVILQEKLVHSDYSWVLGNQLAILEMVQDNWFTEIITILTQIRGK